MTSTATRKLKLRLLLDGVECPVIGADITATQGQPASASVHVIGHPSVLRLKPRTLVLLFYYDWLSGSGEGDDGAYKLLFSGDLIGVEYTKTNSSRDAVLVCEDHTSYWDLGYLYYTITNDLDSVQKITEERAKFVGAEQGFYQLTGTNDLTRIIEEIFNNPQPQTRGYTTLQNMLGAIIRMIEVVMGVGSGSGSNQYFKFNSERLNLLGQLALFSKDTTAETVLKAAAAVDFIKKRAEQLGELITLRQLINFVLEFIYYSTAPNPCARFTRSDVQSSDDISRLTHAAALIASDIRAYTLADTQIQSRDPVWIHVVSYDASTTLANANINVLDPSNGFSALATFKKEAVAARPKFPKLYDTCNDAFKSLVELYTGKSVTSADIEAVYDKFTGIASAQSLVAIAARLSTTLIIPDLFFAVAPTCNVLFPDMYGQLRYGSRIAKEPTRMHLTTNMDAGLFGTSGAGDLVYYAPSLTALKSAQSFTVEEAQQTAGVSPFARLFDHERFTGIIPTFSRVDRLAFFVALDYAIEGTLDEDSINDFFIRIANYQFIKQKLANRSLSASGPFNPAAAVGFPMVILDGTAVPRGDRVDSPESASADNEHYVGVLTSVSHTISQNGSGSTSYQLQYARPHRGRDDEFLRELVTTDATGGGTLPLEEAIRPRFMDGAYASHRIGDEVYSELLGCGSVVDKAKALSAEPVNFSIPDPAGGARIPVSAVPQETAVDQIAYVYAGSSTSRADWAERFVSRPVATLPQALSYFNNAFAFTFEDILADRAIDLANLAPTAPGASPVHVNPRVDARLERNEAVKDYVNYTQARALRG